ncbi:MAG: class I SAM-dependent methyltransferase [Chloroflexota bacterium]|nr:MAG: hypothetical protein DLM70_10850 [Chloroflexota bacterium]
MDPYVNIAPFYDLEHSNFVDDIDFYLRHIHADPILEVGVGTGRVMVPLLQAGFEVWGVDTSAAMLAVARERVANFDQAHLIHGAVDDLPPGASFGTILLPLNLLWHLRDLQQQRRFLATTRDLLAPGATLLVDLSNPLTLADRGARGELRERLSHLSPDADVHGWSSCWDDEAEERLYLSLVFDEARDDGSLRRVSSKLELRYLYKGEVELLLWLTGFRVCSLYGSYDLQPFSSHSPNILVIAKVDDGLTR